MRFSAICGPSNGVTPTEGAVMRLGTWFANTWAEVPSVHQDGEP
jgi:hypothetical protein